MIRDILYLPKNRWGICQDFINAMEQQDVQYVHEEADGIFSIPLFSEEFCEVILEVFNYIKDFPNLIRLGN